MVLAGLGVRSTGGGTEHLGCGEATSRSSLTYEKIEPSSVVLTGEGGAGDGQYLLRIKRLEHLVSSFNKIVREG